MAVGSVREDVVGDLTANALDRNVELLRTYIDADLLLLRVRLLAHRRPCSVGLTGDRLPTLGSPSADLANAGSKPQMLSGILTEEGGGHTFLLQARGAREFCDS